MFRLFFPLLMLLVQGAWAQIPAFPGAEGFGRMAQGGRGGSVIAVTNLNDNGPGSLREALGTEGPRTIVFRVGGIIDLQEELQITSPFVTIAAQTAPGDGIVLKNFGISIFTHDVTVCGLRIRIGDELHTISPDNRDCIAIQASSYNIIFDHCSFSWGLDENVSIGDGSHHITVQWSIISEGLFRGVHPKGPHSMGLLVGVGTHSASVHHCVFAHNNGRNPLFMGATDLEFVNNTLYDWGYASEFQENGAQIKANIIGNRWKPLTGPLDFDELPLSIDFDGNNNLGSLLHISGNTWPGGPFLTSEQIAAFGANGALFPSTSVLTENSTVTAEPVQNAFSATMDWAGAIHPQRDGTDIRVLQQLADSTGGLVDCIRPDPLTLDSGQVLSATSTSILYSVLDDAIKYSAEGRSVTIVSGTGAGQSRTGVDMVTIDQIAQIVEAVVDAPWDIQPDATSQFRITALCTNTLGGYPTYSTGIPYNDTDNDGMSDDWETSHGLDPNDAEDRNGTGLSDEGYTNLEVFLNEYYEEGPNTGLPEMESNLNELTLQAYPNPFSDQCIITCSTDVQTEILITDLHGRPVRSLEGRREIVWDGKDGAGVPMSSGMYVFRAHFSGQPIFGKAMLVR